MNLKKIFEHYIFKVRYVFIYSMGIYENDKNVSFFSMTDARALELINDADDHLAILLTNRINNPAWIFFYYHENKKILGYSFLHVPEHPEWNDSLPTLPGEARLGSNYVYPQHRGKRIRGTICKQQINYAKENDLKLWSVIEKSNTSSLRAEDKYCLVKKNNYLIKFYARNIFSVVTNPFRAYLLLGERRARR